MEEGKVAIYCDTHFVLQYDINFLCIAIYRYIVTPLLATTFEPKEMGLSYFICVFIVERPSCWNPNFLPHDLDLDF